MRRRASRRSATSPSRCTSPGRPGTRRGCSWSRRRGGCRCWSRRRARRRRSSTSTRAVDATGERGLLSIAFAPDYATSGLFYVFLTANDGDAHACARAGAAPTRTVATLGRDAVRRSRTRRTNHNGGQLAFGPDGRLYVEHRRRRRRRSRRRAGPRQPAREDPAARSARGDDRARASGRYGLRNPWRFSFDRATGDHGDRRRRRGHRRGDRLCAPRGRAATSAGHVRGHRPHAVPARRRRRAGARPAAHGRLLRRDRRLRRPRSRPADARSAATCSATSSKPTLLSAALGSDTVPRAEGTLPVSAPTSLGEDACGHVYVAQGGGAVSRIDDGAGCAACERARGRTAGRRPPRRAVPARAAAGCAVRVAAASSAPGASKLRLRARRSVQRDAPGARLPRAARHASGPAGARVVRITPTRKRLRRLARGDRRQAAGADHRPHPRRGRQARACGGSGRASVNGERRWRDPPRRPTASQRILPRPFRGFGPLGPVLDALQTVHKTGTDIRPFHRTNVQTPDFRSVGWIRRRREAASGSRIAFVSGALR